MTTYVILGNWTDQGAYREIINSLGDSIGTERL